MLRTMDLRGQELNRSQLLAMVPRSATSADQAVEQARVLVEDVRARGVKALQQQARDFDRVSDYEVRVPQAHLDEALAALLPDVRNALKVAIDRVRLGSSAQVPASTQTTIAPGATITQRWQPVERVGLYVPGGKAVYPSSVVMNVVAAQAAGVSSIALASPPQASHGGRVHPVILAAAQLLGVTEVYAMGGAGAIAAFAYGVPEIELTPVNVVTGPGNVFVAAAKRLVRGVVGIDSEAGPTEILIIADDSANPRFVAADLISQAEHDEMASAVLVTDNEDFAFRVASEVDSLAATTKHAPRVEVALSGQQSAIVLIDSLSDAAEFSNAYAPEHLEIHTRDDQSVLAEITNAGAIFLGGYTPVSLGDYSAGSNHVLPTAGQAASSAALGAYTFLRPQQVVTYSKDALAEVRHGVVSLAHSEDLPAHGDAIAIRFEES